MTGIPRPPRLSPGRTLPHVSPSDDPPPPPAPLRPRLTRTLILIGLTSLLTDVSSEMVYPLLPFLVVQTLGASATILGLIEGLAESIPAMLKVYSGRLSDRSGRRKPLAVGGYAFSALGKVFLALASGWGPVLAGRVVDRLGKGIRSAPRDALIADTTHKDHRGHAFGFHRMMDTTGAAIGVLAAYLILSGRAGASDPDSSAPIRVALWVSIVPAVLAVAILTMVREARTDRPPRAEKPPTGAPRGPAAARRLWKTLPARLRAFLIISLIFALAGSSNQFLLLRAQQLIAGHGGHPIHAAAIVCLFYLIYNLIYAAASYPFGRLSDRIGRKPVLIAGYALYAIVYAAFVFNDSPGWCWILFGLYGLYPALTEGVEKALVSDMAPAPSRATTLGLHGTLQAVGLFPASLIGGILWDRVSPSATFAFGALAGAAAAIGLAFLPATPGHAAAEP